MVKVPRKVGIAIALTGLLLFGGFAYGVSKIKFKSLKMVIQASAPPFEEMRNLTLNENLAPEFASYEYQFLLAEYYSQSNEYDKAISSYEKAIQSAKKSVGAKSFFTFGAYNQRAMLEHQCKHYEEAHEDFKAALKALPDRQENSFIRWITESWLISTSSNRTGKENIPFYRQHLALSEKLVNISVDPDQFVHFLWLFGSTLDDDEQYTQSEPIWNRMINNARTENFSNKEFERLLIDFARHEINSGHYTEADKALQEASKIADQEHDGRFSASVLEAKGDLRLRQNDLDKAENALQANLKLRKKLNDNVALGYAYMCLEEVARRRGDLSKREEYEKVIMELTDEPKEKARCLLRSAIIAAQNNGTPRVKKYLEQRKQLIQKDQPRSPFIFEQDMKNLLVLYPQLNRMDKNMSLSDSANNGFDKLKLEHFDFHRNGYYLSPQQANRLMDAISSNDLSGSKK
jgi:tetratricopeptide (TPR) repeat protein